MVCKEFQLKITKTGNLVTIKLPASIAIPTTLIALPPYGRGVERVIVCFCKKHLTKFFKITSFITFYKRVYSLNEKHFQIRLDFTMK